MSRRTTWFFLRRHKPPDNTPTVHEDKADSGETEKYEEKKDDLFSPCVGGDM